MSESDTSKIRGILRVIADRGDLEGWWPGQGDEVVIGAVLTQQTRWENVDLALTRMKEVGLCDLRVLYQAPERVIEDAIHPAGFFRVKTRRLKALSALVVERYGTLEHMRQYPLETLRRDLLEVQGIGPETADSILCFGLQKPALVVDRYTERICACAGINEKGAELQVLLKNDLRADTAEFRRMHAQFVEHAKMFCGRKRCEECGIAMLRG
jgi:endonuclease-3 related protein